MSSSGSGGALALAIAAAAPTPAPRKWGAGAVECVAEEAKVLQRPPRNLPPLLRR
jgi:hypothetical protein